MSLLILQLVLTSESSVKSCCGSYCQSQILNKLHSSSSTEAVEALLSGEEAVVAARERSLSAQLLQNIPDSSVNTI